MVFRTAFGKASVDSDRKGFTLVELLIVLSILALLLTIALPSYFGSIQRAKETALRENLTVLRQTFDKFYADRNRYPASLNELVELKYLKGVPIDPVTESSTTWRIETSGAENAGLVNIRSGASGVAQDGTPYSEF